MPAKKYYSAHVERLIKNNLNLYKQKDSICAKCHDIDEICCIFCFCPLYHEDCPGAYITLENGVKDCSGCHIPHNKEFIKEYLKQREGMVI